MGVSPRNFGVIMEAQIEKSVGNEMETGIIYVFPGSQNSAVQVSGCLYLLGISLSGIYHTQQLAAGCVM